MVHGSEDLQPLFADQSEYGNKLRNQATGRLFIIRGIYLRSTVFIQPKKKKKFSTHCLVDTRGKGYLYREKI